uniref:Sortilin-related VPS10 domain containing receptor 2 n=1 Tax=Cyprinus carpio TaxID=7962 RepID=A0A8C1GIN0_CYPCA
GSPLEDPRIINERDQMLFMSTDEGSSFQRQPVSFTVDTLLFHPSDEDNLLAYSKEAKLYISTDLGHKWTVLQEPFFVCVFCLSPGYLYVTCLIQNCSDKMVTAQFLGKIDHNSLSVQDEYIFVKVTTGNRTKYYVSYRRNEFVQMRFPKYALPKDLQIVSTDENQVFLALQEWYQTDTYNLYQSDPQGVYYSIVLENVRSTKQPEENVLIDILEVRGIKGVFLANQKIDGKVMTLITYNKGRDWEPLAPPTTDMNGKPVSCKQPDCHLHLHLRWADNPYVSGTVHTKDSAPGLIMGAGNLGSQLVEYKEEMYITSDCGKTWRQVFEEEHHILYLDHGGVIVAIKDTSIPLKILKCLWMEGWINGQVEGLCLFMLAVVDRVFGHISYRSDWELVKVDFRQSFPRQCTEADYDSWKLTDLQREKCIMGQERMYRRRKESSFCIKGKSYTSALTAKPCQCTEKDFACDYGFERAPSLRLEGDRCYPDFWHDPDAPPENCHMGHSYKSSTGYRKVIANVCEGGLNKEQSAKQHSCPLLPPSGLQKYKNLKARKNVPLICSLFFPLQGDTTSTRYQVDLMDGVRAIYENLTVTDEPIQHRYEKPGVYRVNVKAENSAGHDQATLYIQVTAPLQDVHLEVVPIAGRNQEVNLTAIVLPTEANLTVFYWWIGDNLQPKLTLENSLITRFSEEGEVPVTVQASNGRSMVQDSKTVIVYDHFQVIPLSFSHNLDRFNPNIPEWRRDVGQVVTKILLTGVPQDSLVTMVKPGLPTTADLYVLPQESTPVKRSVFVDKQVLSENNVSFIVRGGLRVLVTLADSDREHELQNCDRKNYKNHGSLLRPEESSLTHPWLRFRKLPGRNVYAQMHNEKEQEMTSPVNHSEDTQNIIQGEEFIDDDLDSQTLGNPGGRSKFSYPRLTSHY